MANNTSTPTQDIIAAPATPQGRSALAIIRISGNGCIELVNDLLSRNITDAPSHTIHYCWLHHPDGTPIDEVMVAVFRAPRTYTREDMVEIYCHGSPLIVRLIMDALQRRGCRPAHPGEFTLRAYLNGRIDLTQAEAIAELIEAESPQAHQLALRHLRGDLTKTIKQLRQKLLEVTTLVELELDFSEEDVEFASREQIRSLLTQIKEQVEQLLASYSTGMALREGIQVVIAGRPNAGKSTLLNAILGEERAIVSPIPGTTRDWIEERITLDGYLFRLVDTAGLRQATDIIEQIGVERTREKLTTAHIVLFVCDSSQTSPTEILQDIQTLPINKDTLLIIILNKTDIAHPATLQKTKESLQQHLPRTPILTISAHTRQGITELLDILLTQVKEHLMPATATIITSARHYHALQQAHHALTECIAATDQQLPQELLATHLREVVHHLGLITGEITTDDILNEIFSHFCIGK